MNDYKDRHGDIWTQGGAGGAHYNKSQNERDIKKGINTIIYIFFTLFGKSKTQRQKIIKILLWCILLLIIGIIIYSNKL